jgi:large subunit ribosomal protein L6
MSRIGKLPVKLADKTKATVSGRQVSFEGPKGKMVVQLPAKGVKVTIAGNEVRVEREDESRESRSLHGLTRTLLANAAKGVSTGFERRLDIRGVGFRAEVKGKTVNMSLGYSHPVVFNLPETVTAEVAKVPRTEDTLPTIDLKIMSANRELVGKTAVQIRALRPPEPYKGKGIKLHEEHVRRKEGKTGTA